MITIIQTSLIATGKSTVDAHFFHPALRSPESDKTNLELIGPRT